MFNLIPCLTKFIILTLSTLNVSSTLQRHKIPIGGIFTPGSTELQSAFKYAITLHNKNESSRFQVEPITDVIDTNDPFRFTRQMCLQLSRGIFTLVTPIIGPSYEILVSYSNTFQMPFIHPGYPETNSQNIPNFGLNIRPEYLKAIADVIKLYRWTDIIYIYDSDDGLIKLQHVFSILYSDGHTLHLRAVKRITNGTEGYSFLRAIEHKEKDAMKYVIVECDAKVAKEMISRHVRDIYMGRRNFHYFFTNLIMDQFYSPGMQIDEFGAINMTGFSIFNRNSTFFQTFISSWKALDPSQWPGAGNRYISADAALMFDGTRILLDALDRILTDRPNVFDANLRDNEVYNGNNPKPGINCAETYPALYWEHGRLIVQYLKQTNIEGLTGRIVFDDSSVRRNYSIDMIQTTMNSEVTKIAEWSEEEGMSSVQTNHHRAIQNNANYENKTFIVTSILDEPYLMFKKTGKDGVKYEGNDRFEGYCKDLADLLAEHLKINYTLQLVADYRYGSPDKNSPVGWNGMVGELIKQEADIAIAPLTITADRERVIDFTKPFQSLGISIMIKKPVTNNPSIFSFMNPLSPGIWMCIILSYFGVSVVMFIVSRFSPMECRVAHTHEGQTVLTNDFTLYNSLWFALGAIMQQGVDVCPRSYAGRIVGSVWWFFTLIIISSYTANLAAFLTVERMVTPINSADDLAKQTRVEYGVLKDASTMEFFKKSKIQVYSRMWEFMNSHPHVFVNSYKEGISRVRESEGNYAFLMESSAADYINHRQPCDTMKVGHNIHIKGYGVGTPLGSPLKTSLNLAILHLTEKGDLTRLEHKWWFDRSECKSSDSKESSKSSLTLYNVAGCFYILIAGLIISMIVAMIEYLWRSRRESERLKVGETLINNEMNTLN
ncbi:glutamate receptor 1-like isoform X1 [Tetranychus urticae]|uniref:glutamate receptor 1-like isoform X1 n=2 Tax=Tetranychus urticae TaxID=32264 RepID=UPI00077BF970|nr:glutamate receptor 1-like isoform X1 [Tetranychus urticae]